MSYNYERVSLSGNKNDQVIHNSRIINQVAKSQVYFNSRRLFQLREKRRTCFDAIPFVAV